MDALGESANIQHTIPDQPFQPENTTCIPVQSRTKRKLMFNQQWCKEFTLVVTSVVYHALHVWLLPIIMFYTMVRSHLSQKVFEIGKREEKNLGHMDDHVHIELIWVIYKC